MPQRHGAVPELIRAAREAAREFRRQAFKEVGALSPLQLLSLIVALEYKASRAEEAMGETRPQRRAA